VASSPAALPQSNRRPRAGPVALRRRSSGFQAARAD